MECMGATFWEIRYFGKEGGFWKKSVFFLVFLFKGSGDEDKGKSLKRKSNKQSSPGKKIKKITDFMKK